MEVGKKIIGDVGLISIFGDFYADQTCFAEYKLLDFTSGGHKFIINCEGLNYIDSKGLGLIVKIHNQVKQRQGKLVICGASGKVKKVFELTKFSTYMQVFDSLDEALAALKD